MQYTHVTTLPNPKEFTTLKLPYCPSPLRALVSRRCSNDKQRHHHKIFLKFKTHDSMQTRSDRGVRNKMWDRRHPRVSTSWSVARSQHETTKKPTSSCSFYQSLPPSLRPARGPARPPPRPLPRDPPRPRPRPGLRRVFIGWPGMTSFFVRLDEPCLLPPPV